MSERNKNAWQWQNDERTSEKIIYVWQQIALFFPRVNFYYICCCCNVLVGSKSRTIKFDSTFAYSNIRIIFYSFYHFPSTSMAMHMEILSMNLHDETHQKLWALWDKPEKKRKITFGFSWHWKNSPRAKMIRNRNIRRESPMPTKL